MNRTKTVTPVLPTAGRAGSPQPRRRLPGADHAWASRLLNDRNALLLGLILLAGFVMSLLSPYFLRVDNLLAMTQYGAVLGLLALGQTLVILGGGGGIDLSVGSTMSLSGVVFGLTAVSLGLDPWIAVLVAVVAGVLLGAVNGLLVTVVGVPPLIATLGTLYLYASAALVLAGGVDINGFDRSGFAQLGQSAIAGIPTQVLLILLPAYGVLAFVMHRSRFGREVYQVGSNQLAASLTGVRVARVRTSLYCISGGLAGLASVVMASWLLNAKPTAGTGMELQAITIAVLGGTAITGGVGRVSGTFLALTLVVVLNSGLQLAGVSNTWQIGLLGAVLIASILLQHLLGRARR
ncbi:sugar ABC transporter permease [Actinotalea ferrariae CF5-4]|uniref:Autoinducer 2 import system permease protein LsrD n=1 Tax=Actinotalea ferrariae CF5-4 TaxID=948458 RepID=A0A021VTZ5_9CELL|nr:ABC transporter permease [Actinotalea ferrariae]EYR63510.1 sugar ABC transporter permease [Actinotalea ferrariae CF5-4]